IPFTAIIILAALLGMAIVIGLAINRLIDPVISLTDITRQFADGDLTQRAAVASRDEIGLLSHSFNQMADELTSVYRSLEQKVEERTRQIRTAAEVAQGITAASNLEDLLRTTTRLIVERFGYYHSGIFMLDRTGRTAIIRAAFGPAANVMLERGHRLEVGSNSIVGWVTANNKPRVASDVGEDPVHFKNTLLPSTRAEVGIPISSGDLVFGALDVQSTESNAFDSEAIIVLQTLANQIAAAMQNAGQVESTQVNFQELERLYRSSRQIAQSLSIPEAMSVVSTALRDSPYITATFTALPSSLRLDTLNDPQNQADQSNAPRKIIISPAEAVQHIAAGAIYDLSSSNVPSAFARIPKALGCQSAAYLPLMHAGDLIGLLMIASRSEILSRTELQPYANLADLTSITIEKILASNETEKRLRELDALASVGQTVSAATESDNLYTSLHRQVQTVIGDYAFTLALYDDVANTIQIPYSYEDGKVSKIDAIPLGEGLISILIKSQQPLMLVEDTERRSIAMGAKMVGRPAQSWMGAPMILNGQPIGALIVQDLEHENAFNDDNMRFLSALSSQLAGVFYNNRLLEDSRLRALQLETAAEIARDISSSLNLDELLAKAVNYIRERFNFYHASIFLLDPTGDFAV
ncbi:MAG TPA: GAF domain-containing protein, partial [Anaerolineales bacterium]